MKARRKTLVRWLNKALPTALICALWVVLWMAWPSLGLAPSAPPRRLSALRLEYSPRALGEKGAGLMPLLFVRSAESPADLPSEESPDAVSVLHAGGQVRMLERPAAQGEAPASPSAVVTNRPAFRLAGLPERVFDAKAGSERRIAVEVSPGLQSRGFRLPPLDASELGNAGKAWQVTLVVECAENGRPSDVFVEVGTTNPVFNAALARQVHAGAVASQGQPCRGRVVLSYGDE